MNSASDPSDLSPAEEERVSPPLDEGGLKPSSVFQEFSEKLASLPTPEERVAHGLEFMRSSISQEGSPRFREFWEARRQILPCFRENLNAAIRSKLWNEYVELTVEARRLKEILEEQSAFAIEQIDLAIQSIENDLSSFEMLLKQTGPFGFSGRCEAIAEKLEGYAVVQGELNLLNTLASRLNALRKEVIKTDMRIRFKAKFFKRLSELGDQIFPKRKALIEEVSSEFEGDVDRFIAKYFKGSDVVGAPYYALREEIKTLQSMAKVFTLSSGSFNRIRMRLSECWDVIRDLEKDHKKELFEKKQLSSEHRTTVEDKIKALKASSSDMSLRDLEKEIEGIIEEMRAIPLHRDDVRYLRDELAKLRAPFLAAQEQKARALEEAEREALRMKREKIVKIKEESAALQREGLQLDLDAFSGRYQDLLNSLESLEISKVEKQLLERMFRPLKDLLADKKEQSLLNLSEDDRKTLENLRMILQQKKDRRQEIKETLEAHRKTLGNSGLDFGKAIQLREQIDDEKGRLEKANASIQEIEKKIDEKREGI